jgi:hypothetical protein
MSQSRSIPDPEDIVMVTIPAVRLGIVTASALPRNRMEVVGGETVNARFTLALLPDSILFRHVAKGQGGILAVSADNPALEAVYQIAFQDIAASVAGAIEAGDPLQAMAQRAQALLALLPDAAIETLPADLQPAVKAASANLWEAIGDVTLTRSPVLRGKEREKRK